MNAPWSQVCSWIVTTRVSLAASGAGLATVLLLLAATPFAAYGHGEGLELSVSPDTAAAGGTVTIGGEGFAANTPLEVHLTGPNGDAHFEDVTADNEGAFQDVVRIPGEITPGIYLVRAEGAGQEASAELTVGAMAGMAEATGTAVPERDRSNAWRAVTLALLLGVGIAGLVLARPTGSAAHTSA